jgi:hypothetical protein
MHATQQSYALVALGTMKKPLIDWALVMTLPLMLETMLFVSQAA